MIQYEYGEVKSMSRVDITKNNLYLKKLINVLRSEIVNRSKITHLKGRHSDAFVYVTKGSCTYVFENGHTCTVNEGDILYLAHKELYTMYVHTPRYSSIYCDFEFYGDESRRSDVYTPKNTRETEDLFKRLIRNYNSPSKTTFAECMSMLYTVYAIVINSANEQYLNKTLKSKIEDTKLYIDMNFKNKALTVVELAEMADISEVYYRKLFKSIYGESPSKYITSVRLESGRKLMKYPFLTLEECAMQSGFSTVQYFCRVFKKKTGITPAKYRKER